MKSDQNNNWVLSDIELQLCIQLLGIHNQIGVPVYETEQPLEKRMLEAFVHLVNAGLIEYTPLGYRNSEMMNTFIRCLVQPECIVTAEKDEIIQTTGYLSGEYTLMVESLMTEELKYRLIPVSRENWGEQFTELLTAIFPCDENEDEGEGGNRVKIRVMDNSGELLRQIDAERNTDGEWITSGQQNLAKVLQREEFR